MINCFSNWVEYSCHESLKIDFISMCFSKYTIAQKRFVKKLFRYIKYHKVHNLFDNFDQKRLSWNVKVK